MYRDLKIALIYDKLIRFDTVGEYCKKALSKLCKVKHFLPIQMDRIQHEYDLYINIDDGFQYVLPPHLRPSVWWAIDTHLQYEWDVVKARTFDRVFVAQRDAVQSMIRDGIHDPVYLPLACDPEIHQRHCAAKRYDVCFVGNVFKGARQELLRFIKTHVTNLFIGKAYFDEMAKIYAESRIILNRSIKNDVNMRVFEALSCGSLLATNNLDDNGLSDLFKDGEHLITYRDPPDLLTKIRYYLENKAERESIAIKGHHEATARHTYDHRMRHVLDQVFNGRDSRMGRPFNESTVPPREDLVSIIIPTLNQLDYTKRCLDSIEACTDPTHEVIIVDNGSSDATIRFLNDRVAHRDNMIVINNRTNWGYPAAINLGLSVASGNYLLFLNNDTVVTPGWLSGMVRILRANPEVGIVGPMTDHASGPQQIQNCELSGTQNLNDFASRWRQTHCNETMPVSRVVGFCMLVSKEVIDRIGGMDETFGMGNFEDDDFSLRAIRLKYKPLIAKDVFIHHAGGRTFKGAQLDYRKCMLHAWKGFSRKWGLPAEFPADRTYSCDITALDPSGIYSPVPDIRSTHAPENGGRSWRELSPKHTRLGCRNSALGKVPHTGPAESI